MTRAAPLPSAAQVRAMRIGERAARLLAANPADDVGPLDALLADACAAALALETLELRLRRTRGALAAVADAEPRIAARVGELAEEAAELRAQAAEIRALIDRLSGRRRAFERAHPRRGRDPASPRRTA
jgi:hypothetical protein